MTIAAAETPSKAATHHNPTKAGICSEPQAMICGRKRRSGFRGTLKKHGSASNFNKQRPSLAPSCRGAPKSTVPRSSHRCGKQIPQLRQGRAKFGSRWRGVMGAIQKEQCKDDVMMVRAIICCAALVLGLLATLGATAQSAAKGRPLDLMAFMRADAKAGAKTAAKTTAGKTSKHRPGASRSAARADQAPGIATNSATNLATELATDPATPAQPAPLPAAAAYAAHGGDDVRNDVQVVTSDQLNAIDLAMLRSAPETVGAAQKTDTDVSAHITPADAGQARDQARDQVRDQVRDLAFNPDKGAASPVKPAGRGDAVPRDDARDDARNDARDDSWMGRIWSAVGDGFVALMAMLRQLFG